MRPKAKTWHGEATSVWLGRQGPGQGARGDPQGLSDHIPPGDSRRLAKDVVDFLSEFLADSDTLHDLDIILTEACANVCRHVWPTPRQGAFQGRGFTLLRPWLHTPDWGAYGLTRPCATVTGCCHLFPTDVLAATGGFDLRFSPTQYDDLDHDRYGPGYPAD